MTKKSPTLPCNTPCCKCGSNDINRTYYDESQHVYKPINPPRQKSNEFVDRTGVFWVAKKECIVHHCRVCQYEWDSATLTRTVTCQKSCQPKKK